MINVILCGGSGERLWPLSRKKMPKQFINLFEGKSLFQETVLRNKKVADSFLIVCNTEHYFLVKKQFESLKLKSRASFLLEPVGRNTAPAIALACFSLNIDDCILVTPSDHLVGNQPQYIDALKQAEHLAEKNKLITFGIRPNRPETGYGYIQRKGEEVLTFHEKPTIEKACQYIESGDFLWNSGMFCFKTRAFLSELNCLDPELFQTSKQTYEAAEKDDAIRFPKDLMSQIPSRSVDIAVMEKSPNIKVIESKFEWSDLGSFDTLFHSFIKSSNGNASSGNVVNSNSVNCFVWSKQKRTVMIDTENLLVIDTPDNLLIAKAGSAQRVKSIVNRLKEEDPMAVEEHWEGHRPWGQFSVLEENIGYKIKKIIVAPGRRLSLQKHQFRSEHWVVVQGKAFITVGDTMKEIQVNESSFIPIGQVHRLENRGEIDLIIIEVQVGSYTGEDDILRIEDDFKRFIAE